MSDNFYWKRTELNKSRIVQCTIGVNEGYYHNNKDVDDFSKVVQDIAEEYYNKTGAYISFNITKSITTYRKNWGCPEGGEITYTLTATPNPGFIKNEDIERYISHCYGVLRMIAAHYKQSTILVQLINLEKSIKYEILYDDNHIHGKEI